MRLSSAPARLAGPVYPDWQVLSTVPSQEDGARTGLQAVGVSGTLGIPTPASTTTTSRRRVRPWTPSPHAAATWRATARLTTRALRRPAQGAGVVTAAGGLVVSRLPVPAAAAAAATADAGSRLGHPWAETMASPSQDSEVPLTPTACDPVLRPCVAPSVCRLQPRARRRLPHASAMIASSWSAARTRPPAST